MQGMYDLHVHTTASDGTFAPRQLVEYAKERGLAGIGITDHDTTDGIEEAIVTGHKLGIEIIPGVEINTEFEGKEVHVLGYYFDRNADSLQTLFATLRSERTRRMERILAKLTSLDIEIRADEVLQEAGAGAIGRPHVARVLIRKGIARDMREAFDRFLGRDGAAYVERYKLHPADAIRQILQAGGVPILAHPGLVGKDALIEEMIPAGLMGIEVAHPDHPPALRESYAYLANRLHLIATGGSDFHGSGAEHRGDLGSVTVDQSVIRQLKEKSGVF
jgi:predicted metal-dependent phosphoesterase TrpH